jgi:hypothetical protein
MRFISFLLVDDALQIARFSEDGWLILGEKGYTNRDNAKLTARAEGGESD